MELESEDFKNDKKNLRNAIYKSKKLKWGELRQNVNNDPWELGYIIIMRKLSTKTNNPVLERDTMRNIVDPLVPTHPERTEDVKDDLLHDIPLFREGELHGFRKEHSKIGGVGLVVNTCSTEKSLL